MVYFRRPPPLPTAEPASPAGVLARIPAAPRGMAALALRLALLPLTLCLAAWPTVRYAAPAFGLAAALGAWWSFAWRNAGAGAGAFFSSMRRDSHGR